MISGLDHIDMTVGNLEESASLYQRLGFEILRRTEHAGGAIELVHPRMPQTIVELHQATGEPGLRHLAFGVDDIQSAYSEFVSRGLRAEQPPFLYEMTGRWLANFLDADGRKLQFVGPPSPRPDDVVSTPEGVGISRMPSSDALRRLRVADWDIWTSEITEFSFSYDARELCYILEGEGEVKPDGSSSVFSFGPGCLVAFEQGLNCTWRVKRPIRKHFRLFRT